MPGRPLRYIIPRCKKHKKSCGTESSSAVAGLVAGRHGASLPPRHVHLAVLPPAREGCSGPERMQAKATRLGLGGGRSVGHHQGHTGMEPGSRPHPRERLQVGLSLIATSTVLSSVAAMLHRSHTTLHLRNSRNQPFYIYQQQRRALYVLSLLRARFAKNGRIPAFLPLLPPECA
jgi:hypothetical protein